MWKRNGDCASHAVFRAALTDPGGIVTSDRFTKAIGLPNDPPPFPDWVAAWIAAEDLRPWPPHRTP
jgi:hypothetical protein